MDLRALPPATAEKRSAFSIGTVEKRQDVLTAVAALLALIIVEVLATVTAAVEILGGAVLIVFTTPLTTALPLLILAVEALLDVVLAGVTALLDTLLTALALALSGGL